MTGPTNPITVELLSELKKAAQKNNAAIWKRVAQDLEKPSRRRRIVNLYRIDKYAQENEVVVVPGKVLGDGILTHKITIAAMTFSQSAKDKIQASQSEAINLLDLVKKNPSGKKMRIIG